MASVLHQRLTLLSALVQEHLPPDLFPDTGSAAPEPTPLETASLVLLLTASAQRAAEEMHVQEVSVRATLQQQRAAHICAQLEAVLQRAERLAARLEDLAHKRPPDG